MRRQFPISTRAIGLARRCALALLCVTGGCLSWAYQYGAHEENGQWIATQQARIDVSGEVQDEKGLPIDKVRIHYKRIYLVAGYQNLPKEEVNEGNLTVNGKFSFKWDPAESVLLTFEKPGYELAEVTVAVRNTVEKGDYGRTTPPASAVLRSGLVIVLKRTSSSGAAI